MHQPAPYPRPTELDEFDITMSEIDAIFSFEGDKGSKAGKTPSSSKAKANATAGVSTAPSNEGSGEGGTSKTLNKKKKRKKDEKCKTTGTTGSQGSASVEEKMAAPAVEEIHGSSSAPADAEPAVVAKGMKRAAKTYASARTCKSPSERKPKSRKASRGGVDDGSGEEELDHFCNSRGTLNRALPFILRRVLPPVPFSFALSSIEWRLLISLPTLAHTPPNRKTHGRRLCNLFDRGARFGKGRSHANVSL